MKFFINILTIITIILGILLVAIAVYLIVSILYNESVLRREHKRQIRDLKNRDKIQLKRDRETRR